VVPAVWAEGVLVSKAYSVFLAWSEALSPESLLRFLARFFPFNDSALLREDVALVWTLFLSYRAERSDQSAPARTEVFPVLTASPPIDEHGTYQTGLVAYRPRRMRDGSTTRSRSAPSTGMISLISAILSAVKQLVAQSFHVQRYGVPHHSLARNLLSLRPLFPRFHSWISIAARSARGDRGHVASHRIANDI
jgi:hypothetical protein